MSSVQCTSYLIPFVTERATTAQKNKTNKSHENIDRWLSDLFGGYYICTVKKSTEGLIIWLVVSMPTGKKIESAFTSQNRRNKLNKYEHSIQPVVAITKCGTNMTMDNPRNLSHWNLHLVRGISQLAMFEYGTVLSLSDFHETCGVDSCSPNWKPDHCHSEFLKNWVIDTPQPLFVG